jgi:hypothetical protein
MVRKQKFIFSNVAMIVLIINIVSIIYVFSHQNNRHYDPETLIINDISIDVDNSFLTSDVINIEVD